MISYKNNGGDRKIFTTDDSTGDCGTFHGQRIRSVVFNMEKITNIGTCSP